MESSIAVFLMRQHAPEQLPTRRFPCAASPSRPCWNPLRTLVEWQRLANSPAASVSGGDKTEMHKGQLCACALKALRRGVLHEGKEQRNV